jgi:hypothetical protein
MLYPRLNLPIFHFTAASTITFPHEFQSGYEHISQITSLFIPTRQCQTASTLIGQHASAHTLNQSEQTGTRSRSTLMTHAYSDKAEPDRSG